jgi:hypothetical protein
LAGPTTTGIVHRRAATNSQDKTSYVDGMIQFYIFGALLLIALALVVLVAKKQS